ncbi:DAK2 domain-containing protein [Bacillus sp. HMF5848]|uniref:DAK2 domain-containing protein n=1 Tax=Bacillus sp. HMF5848 TaxID=2495421 RepID=UPI000F79F536|nr:DAK2 domain-containing protein [Bacillus sp. HMF5848]RSK26987.1 DAK2 domain-containing protein [Bacillus sp. HMF5848]
MSIKQLDGKRFAQMVIQGATHLANNAKYVDSLNVFPVPDGDTGTNMNLSMTSGAKEVRQNAVDHIGKVGMSLSRGLLMGARGNSGVILSQLFRGFSKFIEHNATISSVEFANALENGVKTAYKAVMKPVEGTILTVAKDAAKKAVAVSKTEEDIIVLLEETIKEAKASLNRTPDLLPVLKEVGVVDSGGQGLVYVYEGFLAELKGEQLVESDLPSMTDLVNAEHHRSAQSHMNTEDIVFGYCTEFMVKFEDKKLAGKPFDEEGFRQDLSQYGDSLLVISDDDVVKVHIHSEQPGQVLSYGQEYGSLINMKIENMREQHAVILNEHPVTELPPIQKQAPRKEKAPYAIITVSMGKGIANLFKSIGAEYVIEGGQTMNPSTEDFVKAIEQVYADKIILLPNNKNIVMAAEQAASIVELDVAVVPSKTVPQGLSALLSFNPAAGLDDNKQAMTEALSQVKTGQITFAVRDTSIDGVEINKDDFMGIFDGKIVMSHSDKLETAKQLLASMISDDDEIVTILQGEDASEEDTATLTAYLEENFTDIEVEIHNGEQPLYAYIFAVE